MKGLIKYFIKYPIWANAIKILAIAFGLITVVQLKSSFFPELENRLILIQIVYPGSSPEEIEQGVIQKIEDNLKGVKGIERYTSSSRENTASINVEVLKGYETDAVLQDVKNAVDRINSFPAGMEPPVVFKQPTTEFAISFYVSGDVDLKTLKSAAKSVENDLRSIEGISDVAISGYPEEEIAIFVSEENMRAYGLTFEQISAAAARANVDVSAGSVKGESEEILIRLESKEYYAKGLADEVVKATPEGGLVRMRDVAEVVDTWEENPRKTFVNGERSVIITVNKVLGENIIDIADAVKAYVRNFNDENKVLKAGVIDDRTISLNERIKTLLDNGSMGIVLVLASLALFLNIRLAFWVSLGIPFSFLGMFLLMGIAGITINVISLFGCILVVGILVDDGIVIAEQIYQNYELGQKPFSAAYKGTLQVLPSVTFAILTTITAFIAFFFLEGRQGENMRDMAFVVIITLLFSLLEAALILPTHLAHSKAIRGEKKEESKIRKYINKFLLYPRDKWYSGSLKFFLKYRILAIAIAIFLTMTTIGAYMGGIIGLTFFPFFDRDYFEISVTMPAGTRENVTEDILDRIETATWEVNEDLERKLGKSVIEKVIKNTAVSATGLFGATDQGSGNIGVVKVVMISGDKRNYDSYLIKNAIREKVGPIYGAEEVLFGTGSIFGKPVSIKMISPKLEELNSAKKELVDSLRLMSELRDITDNDPEGFREIKIKLKEKAYLLGLSDLEVARQIRNGFFGAESHRLQRGTDEIKVWVKYEPESRSSIENFENMRIRLQNGREFPLSELVDYEIERGTQVINHLDGKRELTVEAELVDENAEAPPILARVNSEILPPILARHPSVSLAESGQSREIMKTARSGRSVMSLAMIVMFVLVVLSFRSWLQAVVVFALIPLGLIGASWGHFIQNVPVNMMSAYGLIALMGIIINDSIVFVNTMNQNLASGDKFDDALYKAGVSRFRPILLTTLTTSLGLFPLLAETSRQAQFLIPMAISVAYGLMFGTVFILIFLPVYLSYLNDIKRFFTWLFTGVAPSREEVEPAVKEVRELEKYFGGENLNE